MIVIAVMIVATCVAVLVTVAVLPVVSMIAVIVAIVAIVFVVTASLVLGERDGCAERQRTERQRLRLETEALEDIGLLNLSAIRKSLQRLGPG